MLKKKRTEKPGKTKKPARTSSTSRKKPRNTGPVKRNRIAKKGSSAKSVPAEVVAAIALALRDQAATEGRDKELAQPPSPWTVAARVARMHTRWTR